MRDSSGGAPRLALRWPFIDADDEGGPLHAGAGPEVSHPLLRARCLQERKTDWVVEGVDWLRTWRHDGLDGPLAADNHRKRTRRVTTRRVVALLTSADLAVTALDDAVARRRVDGHQVAGCIVHSDLPVHLLLLGKRSNPEGLQRHTT